MEVMKEQPVEKCTAHTLYKTSKEIVCEIYTMKLASKIRLEVWYIKKINAEKLKKLYAK